MVAQRISRPGWKLSLVTSEAAAFARQAQLLPFDLGRITPQRVEEGADVVVFLHGLFASAGALRPLKEKVGAHTNIACASFSYPPGPGVAALAARLGVLMRELPGAARIHLVGHSLGGLIARWYVHAAVADPRIVQTISLASPFAGTRHARLLPGAAGRDISPGSRLLSQLRERRAERQLPHLSFVAGHDAVVTEYAALPGDEVVEVPHLGHNALLFDEGVATRVAQAIATRSRERRSVAAA